MTESHASASHASHDTILVASLADHSLASSEREAAEALVATCGQCAALHADLVALAAATRAMPTPPRPRGYTLTAADAARLRPGGWRRWVAAFGTSRDAVSRPLAVGLTTLGLAGLLVATIPSVLQGQSFGLGSSSAGASSERAPVTVANPAANSDTSLPSAAASAADGAYGALATSPPVAAGSTPYLRPVQPDGALASPGGADITGGSSKGASGAPGQADDLTASGGERTLASDATGVPTMILVSGAVLIAGLGLFAIRRVAGRSGD